MSLQVSPWQGPLLGGDAVEQLKKTLFGSQIDRVSHEALQAETVRIAVWAWNVLRSDILHSGSPVSTHRALAQARVMWEPFYEASRTQTTQQNPREIQANTESMTLEREILAILEEQGDTFSLTGGFWLPAPLRLVPLTKTQHLLVGGLPTHLLPSSILPSLHLHGSFRHVDIAQFSGPLPTSTYVTTWQFQSLNNWLGPTPPTLSQLMQKFYAQELLSTSQQGFVNQSLEVYAAFLDKPQALRWLPFEQIRDGRYLLRTHTVWGMKQHSIGVIQNHRLIQQSGELRFTDIRRLCYALDDEAKTPTHVVWERERNRIILRSELPARERKQMAAIGELRLPQEGYYPRQWIGITSEHINIVDDMLQKLGVQA